MTKNSALSTFLIGSVAIIILGIMIVIVTEIDQNQVTFQSPTTYEQEQINLIEHLYQNAPKANDLPLQESSLQESAHQSGTAIDTAPPLSAEPLSTETTRLLQTEIDAYQPRYVPTPQFDNAYNVWGNTNSLEQNYEPYYSLKNNPWSPYYKPGY